MKTGLNQKDKIGSTKIRHTRYLIDIIFQKELVHRWNDWASQYQLGSSEEMAQGNETELRRGHICWK